MPKTATPRKRTPPRAAAMTAAAKVIDASSTVATNGNGHAPQHHRSVRISQATRALTEALTASAIVVGPSRGDTYGNVKNFPVPTRNIRRGWQHDIFNSIDQVPELGFAGTWFGNCLAKCTLTAGMRGRDGRPVAAFNDEEPQIGGAQELNDILADLRSPVGGQEELMRSLGENLFYVGECFLVGENGAGIDSETWEILSVEEFHPLGNPERDGYTRYDGYGGGTTHYGPDTHVARLWRPWTRFKKLAWSSVKPTLPILEELVLLTKAVRASAVSRLVMAGLLLLPDELDLPDPNGADGTDQGEASNSDAATPFIDELIEVATKAIQNPDSALATMPITLSGPAEILKEVRLIAFDAKNDGVEVIKRAEAVERFARGVDLPVEIVTGHAATTFANAESIDEDKFNTHVEPMLEMAAAALTIGYAWPKMARRHRLEPDANGRLMVPDEIRHNVVFWDASRLVARKDREQRAAELHKDLLITDAARRRVNGYGEADKPNPDEVAERIRVQQLQQVRTTYRINDQNSPPIMDPYLLREEIQPGYDGSKMELPPAENPAQPVPAPSADATAEPAVPAEPDQLVAALTAAAEFAVERAVERAGAKLRAKAGARKALAASVRQVPLCDLARTLGPTVVAELVGDDDLFGGEVAAFAKWAGGKARTVGHGSPGGVAERAAMVVERLARERLWGDAVVSFEMMAACVAPLPAEMSAA